MKKLISRIKKSDKVATTKSHRTIKGFTELEILRRAYEIYMETGVPYASEMEGLFEVEGGSADSSYLNSFEGYSPKVKRRIQL
jgi:hypothetical protein